MERRDHSLLSFILFHIPLYILLVCWLFIPSIVFPRSGKSLGRGVSVPCTVYISALAQCQLSLKDVLWCHDSCCCVDYGQCWRTLPLKVWQGCHFHNMTCRLPWRLYFRRHLVGLGVIFCLCCNSCVSLLIDLTVTGKQQCLCRSQQSLSR